MEISWLGHSCLQVRGHGVTLITDPYDESLGLSMGRPSADIVTVSHSHPHHSHWEGVEGHPRVLQGPGEYEIGNFYISGMATAHNHHEGKRQINTVFAIHAEGLMLCHLGDLDRMLSPRQIEELGQTDILFVPAGGVCTISTSSVAELVNLVDPRIVIPLHYRTEEVRVDLQPLDPFLDDMGVTEPTHTSRFNVTTSNLPRDLQVVVLERAT